MANQIKAKTPKPVMVRLMERKAPFLVGTTAVKCISWAMARANKNHYPHLVWEYYNNTATLDVPQKDLDETNNYFLNLSLKNDPKLDEWFAQYQSDQTKAEQLYKNFKNISSDQLDSSKVELFFDFFENYFFSSNTIPFFVLLAINHYVEQGGKLEVCLASFEKFNKLRIQNRIYDELFPQIFSQLAGKLNCPADLLSFLTIDEAKSVLLQKPSWSKIARRKVFCHIDYDQRQKFVINLKRSKSNNQKEYFKERIVGGVITGQCACPGKARGIVRIVNLPDEMSSLQPGDILVSINAHPRVMPAIVKAAAVVTDEGGIMCHATLIARELKKPCVVNTKNVTKILKAGDLVEVDAQNGQIKIIKLAV